MEKIQITTYQHSKKEAVANTIKDFIGLFLFITILPKVENIFLATIIGVIAYLLLITNIMISEK